MFSKIVTLFFALIAVAFAAPKPEPSPQILTYSSLDYASPYGAVYPAGYSSVVSPYIPATYSAYSAYPAISAYYKR